MHGDDSVVDSRESELDRYVAHVREDGKWESVSRHLGEVAEMAADFASAFGAADWGWAAGAAHDLGKYSEAFQRRILDNGPRVDHSTAGAWAALRDCGADSLAYAIAGHHGGMPNGSPLSSGSRASLVERIEKATRGMIDPIDAHAKVPWPKLAYPTPDSRSVRSRQAQSFYLSMFTRMVFGSLVDADYLCTERFMTGSSRCGADCQDILSIAKCFEEKVEAFYPPSTELNRARCSLLDDCFRSAGLPKGVYSITAPTGSGKTLALMRFALNHAVRNGMRRVICLEPYTAIIEQNADVYRKFVGENNVIEHHSNFDFDSLNESGCKVGDSLRLAAENWDAPVVVSTVVQFFESFLSNRPSRCRKLHNVANSVIVLDEAQMIPLGYMTVCVKILSELARNYNCTVVLCSATQPALDPLFAEESMDVREIVSNPEMLFQALRRVSYCGMGRVSMDELISEMVNCHQALCVVNSRKRARMLYEAIKHVVPEEPVFCLTTLMHPQHRRKKLRRISGLLNRGEHCLLVATSLVEAGVDFDFETVFREFAGVDSIVQAGGRCNREMKRAREASEVRVFELVDDCSVPSDLAQRAAIARSVIPDLDAGKMIELDSPALVNAYFELLYKIKGTEGLDKAGIAEMLSNCGRLEGILMFPFEEVAERAHLIEEGACDIVIPSEGYEKELSAMREGRATRADVRRLGGVTVGVYDRDCMGLLEIGAIVPIRDGLYELLDSKRYKDDVGLDLMMEDLPDLMW